MTTSEGFCRRAWSETAELQERLVHHPFNEALAAGTLRAGSFAYYLVQDSRYLRRFSAALARAGERSGGAGDAAFFAGSAQRALAVEAALHAGYLGRLVDPGVTSTVPTSSACADYTGWLEEVATSEPYPVLVAALLPCFWVYRHVGERILARTADLPDHPYRAWIDTYADASFAEAVEQIRGIADRSASADPGQVPTMLDAFRRGCEHELAFWDAAWAGPPLPTAR